MAHYSLFVEGAHGKSAVEALAAVGLPELIDARDLAPSVVSPGSGTPSNTPGLLIQWIDVNSDQQPVVGMRPDVQEWKRVGESALWYGSEPLRPVRPQDLLRKSDEPSRPRYACDLVILGEEKSPSLWWIPNQMNLPKSLIMGEDGKLTRIIQKSEETVWERLQAAYRAARFEWLTRLERQWLALPEDAPGKATAPEKPTEADEWDDAKAWNHVAWALSLNYRLFRFAINELRLITDHNAWPALQSTTDLKALSVLQAQSKNLEAQRDAVISAGPSINGGAPA